MCLRIPVCMANSVDPDQTPRSAASDLGLHCLQRPICPSNQYLGLIRLMFAHASARRGGSNEYPQSMF